MVLFKRPSDDLFIRDLWHSKTPTVASDSLLPDIIRLQNIHKLIDII